MRIVVVYFLGILANDMIFKVRSRPYIADDPSLADGYRAVISSDDLNWRTIIRANTIESIRQPSSNGPGSGTEELVISNSVPSEYFPPPNVVPKISPCESNTRSPRGSDPLLRLKPARSVKASVCRLISKTEP